MNANSDPPFFDAAAELRSGMRLTAWSAADLWLASVAIGGHLDMGIVEAITSGRTTASRVQYDVLARALNEHLSDMGRNHPVPYVPEPQ
jgi:hypothetical protein